MKLTTINEVLDALGLDQPTESTDKVEIAFTDSDVYARIYDKMSIISQDEEANMDITFAQMDEDEAHISYENDYLIIKLDANYNDDEYIMTIKEGE